MPRTSSSRRCSWTRSSRSARGAGGGERRRGTSAVPDVRRSTDALIVALLVVFLVVGIGQGWLRLPLLQFFALVPGSLTWQSLIAWPLHVLYTPASNGLGLIISLFVLAWT